MPLIAAGMVAYVFPARAGMSRLKELMICWRSGVPRASGDEPGFGEEGERTVTCSPRERG